MTQHTIEEAFELACKRLRYNIKTTEKALRIAAEPSKHLILGTGGFAIIQANVMHGIVLEECFASIGTASNPMEAMRTRILSHLDKISEQVAEQIKTQIN